MWGSVLFAIAAAVAPTNEAPTLAATPYFRTLDAADGLPSSTVWKIAQDRDGYIWAGTADGLARYDGVDFRVYRNDPNDAASLSGADVTALFVDRDNRIWCGGEDAGLHRGWIFRSHSNARSILRTCAGPAPFFAAFAARIASVTFGGRLGLRTG